MIEIYTTVIIVLTVLLMIANFKPIWVLLNSNLLLYFGRVINFKDLLIGFSNASILTVLFLYPVILPIVKSHLVSKYIHSLISFGSTSHLAVITKITTGVFIISSFIPNTPLVMGVYPFIDQWCQNNGYFSSKYLIPLSYASILGGVNTIIGTSTNLLSRGIVEQWSIKWGFFAPTALVVLPGVCSILLIIFLSNYLLPSNQMRISLSKETFYKCQITFPSNSTLIGQTYYQWLGGHIEYYRIYQNNIELPLPIDRGQIIRESDHIVVCSPPCDLINLLEEYQGEIITRSLSHFNLKNLQNRLNIINLEANNRQLPMFYKVVPSDSCLAIGQQLSSNIFETNYNCLVVAISDNTTKINYSYSGEQPLGETLELEDEIELNNNSQVFQNTHPELGLVEPSIITNQSSLLVYATDQFLKKYANSNHFVSITRYRGNNLNTNEYDSPVKIWKWSIPFIRQWYLSVFLFSLSILISICIDIDILPLLVISLLILTSLEILDLETIIKFSNWEVYLMLILSSNIGIAITTSGLDLKISQNIW